MTIPHFIEALAEVLEINSKQLNEDSELASMSEYDSLAVLAIIALIDDSFGVSLPGSQLGRITTVRSLIDAIGRERFS